jgi:hypothetical protein
MLAACQRDQGVQAGSEGDTFQPRPAATEAEIGRAVNQEMKGELVRVDTAGKAIAIRVENGMWQTFKYDDSTVVEGLQEQQKKATKSGKTSKIGVRNLAGKEGSEVAVRWIEQDNGKWATKVEVTQLSTARRKGK